MNIRARFVWFFFIDIVGVGTLFGLLSLLLELNPFVVLLLATGGVIYYGAIYISLYEETCLVKGVTKKIRKRERKLLKQKNKLKELESKIRTKQEKHKNKLAILQREKELKEKEKDMNKEISDYKCQIRQLENEIKKEFVICEKCGTKNGLNHCHCRECGDKLRDEVRGEAI